MLSERERRFVDAYMGEAAGNATKAAVLAGYKEHTARQQGSRLLTKPNVLGEVNRRRHVLEQGGIADLKERREILSKHARAADNRPAAIKAVDVLNKMDGIYVDRLQHEGGFSVDVTGSVERLTSTLARIAARAAGRVVGGTE